MKSLTKSSALFFLAFSIMAVAASGHCSGSSGPGAPAADVEVDDRGDLLEIERPELPVPSPELSEPVLVVPSSGLPEEADTQRANNNLDIADFDGRLYLAFRTAPDHYASPETRLHVINTTDEESWEYEHTFFMGTDLREPRFLVLEGRLFLYFAVLGSDRMDFEPRGMMATVREGPGVWSEPQWSYLEGFIPWRARVVEGRPMMIGYVGGGNIYDPGDPSLEVHWLTTHDGFSWEPVVPEQPVVLRGGVSEADFAILSDGSLIAVVRNEKGDETGFGSKICRAGPESPGEWVCVTDPRKYDSPLLFLHRGLVYLIGRRNVTETGNYDLGRTDLSVGEQYILYQLDYNQRRKRCSLWQVDPYDLTVSFLIDLPSRGDTCFPSILPRGPDGYVVYNYSSQLNGPDMAWGDGKIEPTGIYRLVLALSEP